MDMIFEPEVIDHVSEKYKMPKNRILVGSITHKQKFEYANLDGVRIIF